MITQCCMVALYEAEKAASSEEKATAKETVALAKGWERRMCNHKEALAPGACLEAVIGPENKHRYVLAADDVLVRRMRRRVVPGLPIMHYSKSVLVLEPMSDLTERHITHRPTSQSAISPAERRILEHTQDAPVAEPEPAPPKRKRTKEPNPLSVKRPKGRTAGAHDHDIPSAQPTLQQSARRHKKRGRGSAASA